MNFHTSKIYSFIWVGRRGRGHKFYRKIEDQPLPLGLKISKIEDCQILWKKLCTKHKIQTVDDGSFFFYNLHIIPKNMQSVSVQGETCLLGDQHKFMWSWVFFLEKCRTNGLTMYLGAIAFSVILNYPLKSRDVINIIEGSSHLHSRARRNWCVNEP